MPGRAGIPAAFPSRPVDAVRDLWILLRAGGLDARLLAAPAGSAAAELLSADAVVLVGSPLYREVAATDDPAGADPDLWQAAQAIRDMVDSDEKSGGAVLPVVLPGGTKRDLPTFLPGHAAATHQVRTLTRRGVDALVEAVHERVGTGNRVTHHDLHLAVSVERGRLRSAATLAGTLLCARDEPLPFGRDEVWSLLDLPNAEARLARLGQRLSAALFDADSLDQLTTLVTAADEGTVIDVVITADGPAHELPFEMIRLTDQRVLATVNEVRFTRSVAGVRALANPPTPGPLKILVAVGAPTHTANPALDIEAEMQAIVNVVGGLGHVEVTILEVAGPQEIADALRRDAYHVLHLSAHGSPYGVELEDRDGNAVEVQAEDLVRALRRGGRPLPLIVLSSCGGAADADTGLATTLLRHGADRVIAMQTTVTDQHATRLLTGVYRALAEENTSVAAALARARSELYDEAVGADTPSRPEYGVPTLFAASDGPLWDGAAQPVPLHNPTELPTGLGVRELLLGELVGRRAQLRIVSRILRDEVASAEQPALVNRVVLTGAAGIGKTALAGRVVNRLRDDVDDPWSIVVHGGSWNPPQLTADIAATPAGAGIGESDDQTATVAAISEALRTSMAERLFWAAFANTGQICLAAKRVYIHTDIYPELTQALAAYAATVRVGDPAVDGVHLGPVSNRRQYDTVLDLIDDCQRQGHTFLTGGMPEPGPGFFVPVTLVDNPPEDSRIVREEQFGPVLPLMRYSDVDDVVTRANAGDYALGASVWSADPDAALAIARRLDAGTVWVNEIMHLTPQVAFGGRKQSGIGVESGHDGLIEFTEAQTITVRHPSTSVA